MLDLSKVTWEQKKKAKSLRGIMVYFHKTVIGGKVELTVERIFWVVSLRTLVSDLKLVHLLVPSITCALLKNSFFLEEAGHS